MISAIFETDAASKKFLVNKSTAPEQLRVINRCEIMLKVIKRLLPVLSTIVNNSISMNTIYNKSTKRQNDSIHQSKCINSGFFLSNLCIIFQTVDFASLLIHQV